MTSLPQRPDFREHLKEESADEQTTDVRVTPGGWQGITAMILAILGIYFLWVPILNFLLALLAMIFGIWGLRSSDKTASVTAVIVGAVNLMLTIVGIIGIAVIWKVLTGWTHLADGEWSMIDDDVHQEEYVQEREQVRIPRHGRSEVRTDEMPRVSGQVRSGREVESLIVEEEDEDEIPEFQIIELPGTWAVEQMHVPYGWD